MTDTILDSIDWIFQNKICFDKYFRENFQVQPIAQHQSKTNPRTTAFVDLKNCLYYYYFNNLNLEVNPSKCNVLTLSLQSQDAIERSWWRW